MALASTNIQMSTTPTLIFSTATTWAHSRGATVYDKVPLAVCNLTTQVVYLGSSSITTAAGAIYLAATQTFTADWHGSDALYGITTNSTGTVGVMAGRQ